MLSIHERMTKLKRALFAFCFLLLNSVYAAENNHFAHPFYMGLSAGWGSTTWTGLVPPPNQQNVAVVMSVPVDVNEGGFIGGAVLGYEFTPYFALEASYTRYPDAKVSFDSTSIFTFQNDGMVDLITKTHSYNLMAKIQLVVPCTKARVYSAFGAALTHRSDQLRERNRVTPAFGGGINYLLDPHIMADLGANYTAGYGESELDPSIGYMPFLYSVFLRISYRF